MHFLIYGAGALGQALGCLLAAHGHRVSLLLRQRFLAAIQQNGLKTTGIFGTFEVPATQLDLITDLDAGTARHYDYLLITTKSYDTGAAIAELSRLPDCSCPVVSLQNGCGNLEQLIQAFGPERSMGGRVITGFEIRHPGEVVITVSADAVHIGGSVQGQIPEAANQLAATIAAAGLPCTAVPDIRQSLYAKLLYNCALNPLGAILGVNYGQLSEYEDTRSVMDAVISETFQVITAIGGNLPWQSAEEYRQLFYQSLLPSTYDHRPSMLQDLENRKPTEVDALVGYVASQARRAGLAAPYCTLLTALIRFREQANPSQPKGSG